MVRSSNLVRALLLFLLGVGISIVIVRWLMRETDEDDFAVLMPAQRPAHPNIRLPLAALDEDVEQAASASSASDEVPPFLAPRPDDPDDLTQIDGIGPVYAKALGALGIATFGQLAKQDVDQLAEKLINEGVRVSDERIRDKDWLGQAKRLAQAVEQ